MSVDAHIQQLELRHQNLESELAALSAMPSATDVELAAVKRKKLQLKDEIAKLKSAS